MMKWAELLFNAGLGVDLAELADIGHCAAVTLACWRTWRSICFIALVVQSLHLAQP